MVSAKVALTSEPATLRINSPVEEFVKAVNSSSKVISAVESSDPNVGGVKFSNLPKVFNLILTLIPERQELAVSLQPFSMDDGLGIKLCHY